MLKLVDSIAKPTKVLTRIVFAIGNVLCAGHASAVTGVRRRLWGQSKTGHVYSAAVPQRGRNCSSSGLSQSCAGRTPVLCWAYTRTVLGVHPYCVCRVVWCRCSQQLLSPPKTCLLRMRGCGAFSLPHLCLAECRPAFMPAKPWQWTRRHGCTKVRRHGLPSVPVLCISVLAGAHTHAHTHTRTHTRTRHAHAHQQSPSAAHYACHSTLPHRWFVPNQPLTHTAATRCLHVCGGQALTAVRWGSSRMIRRFVLVGPFLPARPCIRVAGLLVRVRWAAERACQSGAAVHRAPCAVRLSDSARPSP